MSKILVITSLPDPHIEIVKKHLPQGVSIQVFDPRELALSGEITISQKGFLKKLGEEIPLSIWYRKPKFLQIEDLEGMSIPKDYFSSILSLHEEGYSLIFAAYPDCLWVSNPYAIKKASNKLTQLLTCLLYTSDAADDLLCVDLGGRRIIKKKTHTDILIC